MASLNYLGSKKSLMPYIAYVVDKIIDANASMQYQFCDLFSGSGCVSNYYKNHPRISSVLSNDMEIYAYVISRALLKCEMNHRLAKVIDRLNIMCSKIDESSCACSYDLVTRVFASGGRMYFTLSNALKIDRVRQSIGELFSKNVVSYDEFVFLLASLLCSASAVSNTCGTFRAHLKHISLRAKKTFKLSPVHQDHLIFGRSKNVVKNKNAINIDNKCIENGAIVYIDPPYTSAHYGAYYSFLNYLCIYNSREKTVGTGILVDYNKSRFGLVKHAYAEFKKLLFNPCAKAAHIILSYSSCGIIHIDTLVNLLRKRGNVIVYKIWYKAYKANQNSKRGHVVEYLIHLECFDASLDKSGSISKVWLRI